MWIRSICKRCTYDIYVYVICILISPFLAKKHIVGVVKEKEEAHKEYQEAIEQGHGAYLLDDGKGYEILEMTSIHSFNRGR
jgi:Vault protein inter-alpha-trypsin domain